MGRDILLVVGTRPEAIKMAPVAHALAARPSLAPRILLTGQHGGLDGFGGLAAETLRFDPRDRSPARLREALHRGLARRFAAAPPDLVLVHGDTSSALAGAMAARAHNVPLGHVEAGLRSFDLRQPWPEEGNRMAIDALADLLFAPTEGAAANLAADWRVKGRVLVTGNTGIDALFAALAEAPPPPADPPLLLVTCHRKENQGAPTARICAAVKHLVRTLPVEAALPLHPNRHVRAEVERLLGGEPGVTLLEPLAYPGMIRLLARSWAILSDSGGLQEEGPALGKPVLVLRDTTERPEAIACGSAMLVGTEEERIVAAVNDLFNDAELYARMSRPAFPFGDGRAAARIAAAVEAWFRGRPQPRPRPQPA